MRLIDADTLIYHDITDKHGDTYMIVHAADIDNAPTIDAQPVVHAKWVISSDGYYPYCKNCNARPKGGEMTKYCPECGARMDGDE